MRSVYRMPVIEGRIGASLSRVAQAMRDEVLSLTREIAEIPAPTNDEWRRSDFLHEQMHARGLFEVERDNLGDLTGVVPGRNRHRRILIAAHIDTVFPLSTSLETRSDGERLYGPGIGDNSLGVAAVLILPKILAEIGVTPAVDVVVTGNVGEEGLGNLRGMRAVMERYAPVGAVVAVEGHNLGRLTHVAVGSRRLRVQVSGPGGHSWGDFGNANAIHCVSQIITELSALPLPSVPKTTLNVGTVEGGISVNTIPPEASFLLDLRSVDEGALDQLFASVEGILSQQRGACVVRWEILGVRPAGTVSADSRIVAVATAILESIGIAPTGDASSTDANVPISQGIPAICIGLTSGGNVHRDDEFIDISPLSDGLYQLAALAISLSRHVDKNAL